MASRGSGSDEHVHPRPAPLHPWEFRRDDVAYVVRFGGEARPRADGGGGYEWVGGERVLARAHDTVVPGYATTTTSLMRLWSAEPVRELDFAAFSVGDFEAAMGDALRARSLTAVVYPDDSTDRGRRLRLRQQYFFVSASLQDAVGRFKEEEEEARGGAVGRRAGLDGGAGARGGRAGATRARAAAEALFAAFPQRVAVQLNDTHPTIAIPELLRILLDEEGLGWDAAWATVCRTFGFTNHTVLPEALERWAVPTLQALLPRHMQLIYEINHRFLELVAAVYPGDTDKLSRMSIIEESEPKAVRMAVLALVGSHTVNGVAKVHSNLVRSRLFPDFAELWPEQFTNVTNGITPRRWLLGANPELSAVITRWLGTDAWTKDLRLLRRLEEHASDPDLHQLWARAKRRAKGRLCATIGRITEGRLQVEDDCLFDVQCKRIHEYKRQLLNVLGIAHRWLAIRACSPAERSALVPRVCVLAGKAARGYRRAKDVLALANAVANVVNNDPAVRGLLTVAVLPDYGVSLAEAIVPASDISQHISTAGTEASGTSNMKFALNGGLLLGTRDGANVEIAEAVGADQIFLFGPKVRLFFFVCVCVWRGASCAACRVFCAMSLPLTPPWRRARVLARSPWLSQRLARRLAQRLAGGRGGRRALGDQGSQLGRAAGRRPPPAAQRGVRQVRALQGPRGELRGRQGLLLGGPRLRGVPGRDARGRRAVRQSARVDAALDPVHGAHGAVLGGQERREVRAGDMGAREARAQWGVNERTATGAEDALCRRWPSRGDARGGGALGGTRQAMPGAACLSCLVLRAEGAVVLERRAHRRLIRCWATRPIDGDFAQGPLTPVATRMRSLRRWGE